MSENRSEGGRNGAEKPSRVRRIVLIIIGGIALLFVLRAIDKMVGGLF